MTTMTTTAPPIVQLSRMKLLAGYLRRNKSLGIGLGIILLLVLFTLHGMVTVDQARAYPLKAKPKQPPGILDFSAEAWPGKLPMGSDFFGRDMHAAMVRGMWQTALIGVIAGAAGTLVGVVLGFTSAYFGGVFDAFIKGICQILTPIPVFMIQIIIASSLDKRDVTIFTMAWIVVMLAWMGPTLVIRSQVLSMKERQFVSVAKLSGVGNGGIIFGEILPNLLPFIAAAFVSQVFAGVFSSFYLAIVGLGPLREPLLGNIIWGAQSQGAFFNGWWWWPIWPAAAMVLILSALALINMGLDELANPRIRRTE
ncbi:MAG: ABC transporter permease [Chloroflexi bacterium]|jgi:peptide/nickel transport system permease protein|nr:MAG: ABC transporter permease [Chloroflexota bacterium]